MKYYILRVVVIVLVLSSCSKTNEPILKIGLIADPQYQYAPSSKPRYYRESLWKLDEAIETLNHYHVDIIQNLGDIINGEWSSFDSIMPVYDKINPDIDNYQLLGNHDFSIDSIHLENLLEVLSMPDFYYSYEKKGWRFIVLDATDYSYFSNALHKYDIMQVNTYYNNTLEDSNKHKWNSAIGEKQQNWLKQELKNAESLDQKVIIFSHLPVKPLGNQHNLWNNYEIIDIIESSSNVVAFINGHNHSGNYVFNNGIHYISISGMVDTMVSSYAILEIFNDHLILRGYGNQKTLHLLYNE